MLIARSGGLTSPLRAPRNGVGYRSFKNTIGHYLTPDHAFAETREKAVDSLGKGSSGRTSVAFQGSIGIRPERCWQQLLNACYFRLLILMYLIDTLWV